MAILRVKSLKKSFVEGKPAVNGVEISVEEGEIICLLGPSGCGKTTLLRLIAGLEIPDEGEVWFAGENMAKVPPHQRDFGMMFQDFALFPHKNVYDNVAFGLRMHRQDSAEIERRVRDMLDLVDLEAFGNRSVEQLSGGEQQRVALARALAPDPRLLMLDEPLGSLDRSLRERLMLELRGIMKRVGVTAVYVTHDQTEAFAVADRLAVMNQGRIEQIDTPEAVYNQPATPFVAHFMGFFNLLAGELLANQIVKTSIGSFQLDQSRAQSAGNVQLLIKPDGAQIMSAANQKNINEIHGQVTAISFRGKYFQVWVEAQDESLMFEMTVPPGDVGDKVHFAISTKALQVLTA